MNRDLPHLFRHLASAAIALLAAACSAPPEPAAENPATQDPAADRPDAAYAATPADPLLPPDRLLAELIETGDDGVLLDVRDAASYDAGHLPTAVRVDPQLWKQLSLDPATGLDHAAQWRHRVGQLGIDANDTVFVIDDGSMKQAARVWFLLQHLGAQQVFVVDGGWPAVLASSPDAELVTEPYVPIPERFSPPARAEAVALADRQRVRRAVDSGDAQVLDVRSDAEWLGQELRTNPRGGHLPGAIHLPHTQLLGADGRMLPPDELARVLIEAGLDPDRPVITHCDGGGRAALAALTTARAGLGPVENYYLSFGDWAADASCPLVQEPGAAR